jgi:membrane-associated protease RseP (regulator of RpoE activity)
MLTYIVPFIVLILIVVFIHEYGHYYFAKKYGVGVTDFSIGFGKEILVGMINQEHVGRYAGSHLEVMLSFLVTGMFILKRIMKKL